MTWLDEKRVKELLETEDKARQFSLDKAGEILASCSEQGRDMTEEETQAFEKFHADADACVARAEKVKKQHASFTSPIRELIGSGFASSNKNEKLTFRQKIDMHDANGWGEYAEFALSTTGTGAGAELVAPAFYNKIHEVLNAKVGLLECPGITWDYPETNTDYQIPIFDDTANTGEIVAQNGSISAVDAATSEKIVKPYFFTSGFLKVSDQQWNSTGRNVEELFGRALGERIRKIVNAKSVVGTGSSQPYGLVVESTDSGITAAVDGLTYNNLLDVKDSLQRPYVDNAYFGFTRKTLTAIKKLADDSGRPLWQAGNIAAAAPATIDGTPYVLLDDMAEIGASAKSVILFDPTEVFFIEVKGSLKTKVLVERYADTWSVGLVAGVDRGSRLRTPKASVYLDHAAS